MRRQNEVTNKQDAQLTVKAPQFVGPADNRIKVLIIGLEILEYMERCPTPVTPETLGTALKVASGSIERALLVLQQRRYLTKSAAGATYERSGKPCQLPATDLCHQRLLGHAYPVMQCLSDGIRQSCHLTIPTPTFPDMRVVAQQESPGPFGINVPVNFRYDIPGSAPGLAFAAFAKQADPARWPDDLSALVDTQAWASLKNAVQKTIEARVAQVANPYLPDVVELSCPIFDNGQFVAALTVPYIETKGSVNLAWCLATLQLAAEQLTASLRSDTLVA